VRGPALGLLPNSRFLLLALVVVALGAAGCGTFDKQKAEKFASVKIHALSEREIRTAISDVFRDHEFKVILTKTNVICEKEGSAGDNFLYGNWVGGEPVWVRIKLTIVPMMEGAYRLQCLAFKVRDKGSLAFEEEVQVSGMGSHHYQKLLEEVADRFKEPAPKK
jgi:hypothetical protein